MSTRLAHQPPISNAQLGTMLFIAAEVMLFSGLVTGYVVLRFGSGQFKGTEPLPIGLTGISTALIAASSVMLIMGMRGLRRGQHQRAKAGSLGALLLGTLFLVLQVIEWNHLMGQGVLPQSSVMGGMFYVLSWAHALHVIGGLVLLLWLVIRVFGSGGRGRLDLNPVVSIYWHFVTIVWLGLFVMLFLL